MLVFDSLFTTLIEYFLIDDFYFSERLLSLKIPVATLT